MRTTDNGLSVAMLWPMTAKGTNRKSSVHLASVSCGHQCISIWTQEESSAAGFRKQLARWGVKAKLRFPVNPLRHACGYALANKGMDTRSLQAYRGHASITVRYTEMSPTRFKGIWR